MAAPECAIYRPRRAETTPLYKLVQAHYADVHDEWEERFEGRYGFWRGSTDTAVGAYLDCGLLDNGFARVRCGTCRGEFLVAYSCKGRGLCPSCAAKRAAALAAFLREEVLAEVGHAQWVFSLPKMLRPYFLYHRPLLGRLCRAAYETAREMIAAASPAGDELTPGMVAVVQTFGDDLGWHAHVHALLTRGGWDRDGQWTPVPFVDGEATALVLRHKVFRLLQRERLLSEERTRLLLSWRHSGFSVHTAVTVPPDDRDGLERLARYLLRAPVSLERLRVDEGARAIDYAGRRRGGAGPEPQVTSAPLDPHDFLARVLMHIPEPRTTRGTSPAKPRPPLPPPGAPPGSCLSSAAVNAIHAASKPSSPTAQPQITTIGALTRPHSSPTLRPVRKEIPSHQLRQPGGLERRKVTPRLAEAMKKDHQWPQTVLALGVGRGQVEQVVEGERLGDLLLEVLGTLRRGRRRGRRPRESNESGKNRERNNPW